MSRDRDRLVEGLQQGGDFRESLDGGIWKDIGMLFRTRDLDPDAADAGILRAKDVTFQAVADHYGFGCGDVEFRQEAGKNFGMRFSDILSFSASATKAAS